MLAVVDVLLVFSDSSYHYLLKLLSWITQTLESRIETLAALASFICSDHKSGSKQQAVERISFTISVFARAFITS